MSTNKLVEALNDANQNYSLKRKSRLGMVDEFVNKIVIV